MVIKGGVIAWAMMGDANASIPTVQPVLMRPMWGATAQVAALNSLLFVSQVSLTNGAIAEYKLKKRAVAVKNCRSVTKKDLKHNAALPKVRELRGIELRRGGSMRPTIGCGRVLTDDTPAHGGPRDVPRRIRRRTRDSASRDDPAADAQLRPLLSGPALPVSSSQCSVTCCCCCCERGMSKGITAGQFGILDERRVKRP